MKPRNYSKISLLLALLSQLSMAHLSAQMVYQTRSFQTKDNKAALLITSTGIIQNQWIGKQKYEIVRQSIEFNTAILSNEITALKRFEVCLFDGGVITVRLTRVFIDVNNVTSILGSIEGTKFSSFYLSTKNGISLGRINLIEKRKMYIITHDRITNSHYMTEVDPLQIDHFECGPPLILPDRKLLNKRD